MQFRYPLLPPVPTKEDLHSLAPPVHSLIWKGLSVILERAQRDPTYPWLDMKFSPVDGKDFPPDDPVRGKERVYSWIQGRGLEVLAEFYRYGLKQKLFEPNTPVANQFLQVMENVSSALWNVWKEQGGHLFFSLSKLVHKENEAKTLTEVSDSELESGHPITENGELYTFSDIFCSRGLFAAALVLKNERWMERARMYCIKVLSAVWEGRIYNDQVSFDPNNPITPVPGRRSHAPYMLMIPTVSFLYKYEPRESNRDGWFEEGLRLIRYILEHHVNLPEGSATRFPNLAPYDFLEYLDTEGNPYMSRLGEEECILSDPGHALEFVGLAATFLVPKGSSLSAHAASAYFSSALTSLEGSPMDPSRLGAILYQVFQRNFQNGFCEGQGGIVKLFDLRSRRPVNPDMPWWSLPETIRAAWGCRHWGEKPVCMRVLASCWNALVQNYIGNNLGDFCIQNRDQEGKISPTIPAVPDIDPLYHTGLPLLTVWS